MVSNGATIFYFGRPRDDERIGVPACMGILFPSFKWGVSRHCPSHWVVWVGRRSTRLNKIFDHLGDCIGEEDAIAVGVDCPVLQAFLRSSVIGYNHDYGVVADFHFIKNIE